jgi:hypothetical protein
MTTETIETDTILKRLEKLEKQNRRYKLVGFIGILLFASIFVMAQVSPKKVIEADKFVVRYPDGKEACTMEIDQRYNFPQIILNYPNGTQAVWLLGSTDTSQLKLTAPDYSVSTSLGASAPSVMGDIKLTANGGLTVMSFKKDNPGEIFSGLDSNGDWNMYVRDKEQYRTVIGSTETVTSTTGETHKASAASITMFNKAGNVIWKAPLK